jgi:hypothetical protein
VGGCAELITREECEAIRDDLADAGGAFTEVLERFESTLKKLGVNSELEVTLGIVVDEPLPDADGAEAAASQLLLLCELLTHQLAMFTEEVDKARHVATQVFYWFREDSSQYEDVDWRTRRAGQLHERAARLERPLGG